MFLQKEREYLIRFIYSVNFLSIPLRVHTYMHTFTHLWQYFYIFIDSVRFYAFPSYPIGLNCILIISFTPFSIWYEKCMYFGYLLDIFFCFFMYSVFILYSRSMVNICTTFLLFNHFDFRSRMDWFDGDGTQALGHYGTALQSEKSDRLIALRTKPQFYFVQEVAVEQPAEARLYTHPSGELSLYVIGQDGMVVRFSQKGIHR